MDSPGTIVSALGGMFLLLYYELRRRMSRLERKQDALLNAILRIALQNGADESIINDLQKAIGA